MLECRGEAPTEGSRQVQTELRYVLCLALSSACILPLSVVIDDQNGGQTLMKRLVSGQPVAHCYPGHSPCPALLTASY